MKHENGEGSPHERPPLLVAVEAEVQVVMLARHGGEGQLHAVVRVDEAARPVAVGVIVLVVFGVGVGGRGAGAGDTVPAQQALGVAPWAPVTTHNRVIGSG